MSDVVQKLWGFCHTLRHDGIDYGDYIEQITFLLFLKMADEKGVALPKRCDWPTLRDQTGAAAMDRDIARRIRRATYFGQDLVARPRRLALMNLYVHGIEPHIALGDTIYQTPTGERFDLVLTNPPFGTRGANQAPDRDDFTISTSNKQLNFVQHILTVLKSGGRAAVVLPDNCLFADQAGEVFKLLCEGCDLHTVLRLPLGTL